MNVGQLTAFSRLEAAFPESTHFRSSPGTELVGIALKADGPLLARIVAGRYTSLVKVTFIAAQRKPEGLIKKAPATHVSALWQVT